jgi:hypothetical protein
MYINKFNHERVFEVKKNGCFATVVKSGAKNLFYEPPRTQRRKKRTKESVLKNLAKE